MLYWPHIGRRVNCGYRPYGSSNFSKCLGDGGFTHLRHNVPCAGGWFASTSISQAAVICSPTRALYMTGLGFPCTMPPILNARVPTAQSDSTPARASINISICRVPCWMNKERTAGGGCLRHASHTSSQRINWLQNARRKLGSLLGRPKRRPTREWSKTHSSFSWNLIRRRQINLRRENRI